MRATQRVIAPIAAAMAQEEAEHNVIEEAGRSVKGEAERKVMEEIDAEPAAAERSVNGEAKRNVKKVHWAPSQMESDAEPATTDPYGGDDGDDDDACAALADCSLAAHLEFMGVVANASGGRASQDEEPEYRQAPQWKEFSQFARSLPTPLSRLIDSREAQRTRALAAIQTRRARGGRGGDD